MEFSSKVSEITTENVINYLRIDDASEIETAEIEMMMEAAKSAQRSNTGLSETEIDEHDDLAIAFLLRVSGMFDNRNAQLDSKNTTPNPTIEEIEKRCAVNYL